MKQINVYFEESEYDRLIEVKNETSWHDFIMNIVNKEDSE